MTTAGFHGFIHRQQGQLVLQPRMGFSEPGRMRAALLSVKALPFPTIGTITVDSFSRTGHLDDARVAVGGKLPLNGYPILIYSSRENRALLEGVRDPHFPIQVRHGTPLASRLIRAVADAGIDSTEGGPVSYCLPYGRTSLSKSIADWSEGLQWFAEAWAGYGTPHVESFGGCLLGQLCPPALLVATSVLESLFFQRLGIESISLSYAQGTNADQDAGAISALRRLAGKYLRDGQWHVVLYTYMGLFPKKQEAARYLIEQSARLARTTCCERLVVKTMSEAYCIPSIEDNLAALRWASAAAASFSRLKLNASLAAAHGEGIYEQASALIDCVLNLSPDLATGLATAFRQGYLDIPYCLHPDNRGLAKSFIDADGNVEWADLGKLPLPRSCARLSSSEVITSTQLMRALSFYRDKLDCQKLPAGEEHPSMGEAEMPIRVVLTTLPSDSHSWNLVALELALRERGMDVTNLGVCVPIALTLRCCLEVRPHLLVVSTVNGHGSLEGLGLAETVRACPILRPMILVMGGLISVDPDSFTQHADRLRAAGFDAVFRRECHIQELWGFLEQSSLRTRLPIACR